MPRYRAMLSVRGYVNVYFDAEDDAAADAYADASAADLIDWMDFEPSDIEVDEVEAEGD